MFPVYELTTTNFNYAWSMLTRYCAKHGVSTPTEYGNKANTVASIITLHGNAINQIEKKELHPQYPTREIHLEEYIKQFKKDYDWKKQGFKYTYISRLSDYRGIDQLQAMKEKLKNPNIGSRRIMAITWIPHVDLYDAEPPCLQIIQLIPINNKKLHLNMIWRSRDCYNSFQSNIIAVVDMLNEYVIDDKTISSITDYTMMMHIYDYDVERALSINVIPEVF